jgi:hypothetical protein
MDPLPPPLLPEPWASWIDLVTASQSLERAIHAATPHDASLALRAAASQVRFAAAYQETAHRPAVAAQLRALAQRLQQYAAQAATLSTADLPRWQQGPWYRFQGELAAAAVKVRQSTDPAQAVLRAVLPGAPPA